MKTRSMVSFEIISSLIPGYFLLPLWGALYDDIAAQCQIGGADDVHRRRIA